MNLSMIDRLNVMRLSLFECCRIPGLRKKIAYFVCPVDSTRYIEFSFVNRCVQEYSIKTDDILDVSSPFMMSYILNRFGSVVKTDINPAEKKRIAESSTLRFEQQDATRLTYPDSSFDLVYSISVIEHIHGKYLQAAKEMLRVLRPGGHLILTFPVGSRHREEWLDEEIYSHQHKSDGRVFFEYRLDENDVQEILSALTDATQLDLSVFWERRNGLLDATLEKLKVRKQNKMYLEIKKAIFNIYAGFFVISGKNQGFDHQVSSGIACILLKKTESMRL